MNSRFKKIVKTLPPWFLTGVTLVVILWLTLSPRPFGELNPPLFPGADKLGHALMFGFLVAMMALDKTRKRNFHKLSPLYLICCAIFSSSLGVAIEYIQEALHTGRAFE